MRYKQFHLFGFLLLFLMMSCSSQKIDTSTSKSDTVDNLDGYGYYSGWIPGFYVEMLGLKPYRGEAFCIEPHTRKYGKHKYVLRIEYVIRVLSDKEDHDFRGTTGEKSGRFLNSDAHPGGYILCSRFDGITITSSADYNDVPAGKSLSSKIMLFTWSVWPSIKAGKDLEEIGGEKDLYSSYFNYNPIPYCDSYSPVNKSLDDLEEGDLYYLGADNDRIHEDEGCCPVLFLFTELPDVKQHVFTVTYYEGKKSWSVDIPANFEITE